MTQLEATIKEKSLSVGKFKSTQFAVMFGKLLTGGDFKFW